MSWLATLTMRFDAVARLLRTKARRDVIGSSTLDQLPLSRIETVTFFKRDELATDLICCQVEIGGRASFFHEEAEGWDLLLRHLEKLPDFRQDWYDAVVQPPFAACETVAYRRNEIPSGQPEP